MALADFLPRRSANSIEAADALPPSAPASASGEPPRPAADDPRKPAAAAATRADAGAVAGSYYVEDLGAERRYWQDYQRKTLAFAATETRLSSAREDLRTVGDMVELAAARGWQSIAVKGSETFRREAWIEAAARGIEAQGYKASDPDRQEAERRRAERGLPAPAPAAAPARADAPTARTAAANDMTPAAPAATAAPSFSSAPTAPASPEAEFRLSTPVAAPRSAAASAPVPTASPTSAAPPAPSPTAADHRRAVREAERDLSPDGKLILAALSEKIDRQLNRYNADTKAELKAFVAGELTAKERRDGVVALTSEQRRQASAPEAARPAQPAEPKREQEQPRLARSR